jgi:hypothetical protein
MVRHTRSFYIEIQPEATSKMAHADSKASPDLQLERHDASSDEHLEKGESKVLDNTDEDEEFNYEEQRKIIHRIDRRLVVILGFVQRERECDLMSWKSC